ncbi:DsrE family protein [Inmirania thermothiophila]|uniref:Uncharacterized protein n=1 Tax=Inmirania thermothiophila TaxID=1750597 RepID=A0A3N1XSC3_9GAMM|nr:DsrE family protein [Inmirania thermothiophila]ROR29546.1 hypothetical protein EDC57_2216 [Inmirania thermothiophila]
MKSETSIGRRAWLMGAAALALAGVVPVAGAVEEGARVHRLVIHVDENDPKRMNLALNNARNIIAYYQEKGEEVQIEIVAYGPGLHMLRADTSPVKARIRSFAQNFEGMVAFKACGNTKRNMERQGGKPVELLPEAEVVPAGVVWLMERQEQGWSYVRP